MNDKEKKTLHDTGLKKFESVKQNEERVPDSYTALTPQKEIEKIENIKQQRRHREEYAKKTYNFLKIWCITYWVFIFLYVSVFPLVIPLLAGLIGVDLSDMLYSTWGLAYSVGGVTTFVIGVFGYIIKGLFTKDNEVDNTKNNSIITT